MEFSELIFKIGTIIIHGRDITLIHVENGRCIIEYREDVLEAPQSIRDVKIEAWTKDVRVFWKTAIEKIIGENDVHD